MFYLSEFSNYTYNRFNLNYLQVKRVGVNNRT